MLTSKHYKEIVCALDEALAVIEPHKIERELEIHKSLRYLVKAQIYFLKLQRKAERREKTGHQ
jgi:hypothetical protein